MGQLPPIEVILSLAIVIFFGIGLHEYAHCKFADMAGDPTPGIYGRVTLKLWKHFEPAGTFMMIISSLFGVGLGWGRAAPANPSKMRNPRWDFFASVAAGPLSNVVQAILYAFVLRYCLEAGLTNPEEVFYAAYRSSNDFLTALLSLGVRINLGLAIFNLIPLGPLDGHWLVGLLLPERLAYRWNRWHQQYGSQILIAVILFSQLSQTPLLSKVTSPVINALFKLFTGVPLDY